MSKRILMTGAGSGLGRALSRHFSSQGHRIFVTDQKMEAARQTAKEIVDARGQAQAFCLDVTRYEDFEKAVEEMKSLWGGVDLLVNNAGVSAGGTIAKADLKDWQWILDINLMGVVRGTRAVLTTMREQGNGEIVNIASLAGLISMPGMASYNVTKAAVVAFSETLRAEVAHQGIRVFAICPYFFQSNLLDSFRAPDPKGKVVAEKMMMRSKMTVEDVVVAIDEALRKNRFLTIVPKGMKRFYYLKRFYPEALFRIIQKFSRRVASA